MLYLKERATSQHPQAPRGPGNFSIVQARSQLLRAPIAPCRDQGVTSLVEPNTMGTPTPGTSNDEQEDSDREVDEWSRRGLEDAPEELDVVADSRSAEVLELVKQVHKETSTCSPRVLRNLSPDTAPTPEVKIPDVCEKTIEVHHSGMPSATDGVTTQQDSPADLDFASNTAKAGAEDTIEASKIR